MTPRLVLHQHAAVIPAKAGIQFLNKRRARSLELDSLNSRNKCNTC